MASVVVLKIAESLSVFFFFKYTLLLHFGSLLMKQWDSVACHVLLYVWVWTDQILEPNKDHMIYFFS